MGVAVIVALTSGMFAVRWGLQHLWRNLVAGLQRDGIAAIVAPYISQFAVGWGLWHHQAAGLQQDGE